jgi:Xaa-Pro aminopeptidase
VEAAREGPHLDKAFFEGRRHEFVHSIGNGSVAVFEGAPAPSAIQGRFRQQSDFYYLTGFSEPGAVVVLLNCDGEARTVLFPQPRDPDRERSDGPRAGVEGAVEDFGADEAFSIDAAACYGHYSCDVSRTYPVDGSFTPSQRRVYEIVLQAQKAVIGAVQAGTTLKDVHRFGAMALIQGMIKLGWLEDRPPEELFKEKAHRTYFRHAIGHYLGLDTHDAGPIVCDDEPYPLEEGVVFTVEPGIYVSSDAEGALAEYAGIGVRIEDSVIVQAGGCEILTSQIPKRSRRWSPGSSSAEDREDCEQQ